MDRKEQIFEAALDIIAREGPGALTMMKIGKAIGTSDAALYRHFQNKQALLLGLIHYVGQRMSVRVKEAMTASEDPLLQLRDLLRAHLQFIEENRGIPRILFSESVHQNDSVIRTALLSVVRHYLGLVSGVIRTAREQGSLRRDLDVEVAAAVFLGLVQATIMVWSLSGFEHRIADRADALWETALRGWKG